MVEQLPVNPSQFQWQQSQRILELLSTLSYRSDELNSYLKKIACSVSQLLNLDLSVVTFCEQDKTRIMASNLDLEAGEQIDSLHGTLTNTVISTGKILQVEDTQHQTGYATPPEGYRSYLGVPLQTPERKTIGTICSFCAQPRHFSEEELKTVKLFAERAAIAIDNYSLYQQQQDFNQALEIEIAVHSEQLKATQAKLIDQEKLAAIGQFASMIVHEIRNPLTTIVMGLKALNQLKLPQREHMRLSLALEESDRLLKLLQEILLYAKPQILELEEIEVNLFFTEMLLNLRQMPIALNREIQFIPLQEKLTIKADRNKLKQVLVNLVQNACEAVAPGEVVTCKLTRDNNLEFIRFSIHNLGTPIPEEILPKLSEPFVSNKSGGTGLGLAIVKQIINVHQGNLSINSNPIDGTNVSFTIPIFF